MAVLLDGTGNITPAHPSFGGLNATAQDVASVLRAAGVQGDGVQVDRNILLFRDAGELFIIDTGMATGVLPNLQAAGVRPEDVTGVILSHVHFGHHNGLLSGGRPTFPNARVFVSKPEADTNPAELAAYGDRVQRLAPGDRITNNVRFIDTPGHTVSHQAVEITSGGQRLLATVDVLYNQVLSVRRPEWSFRFDSDLDAVVKSRRSLLGMAAEGDTVLHGYHFPFPGIGRIVRAGAGYVFEEGDAVASSAQVTPAHSAITVNSAQIQTYQIVSGETHASYTVQHALATGSTDTVTGITQNVTGEMAIRKIQRERRTRAKPRQV